MGRYIARHHYILHPNNRASETYHAYTVNMRQTPLATPFNELVASGYCGSFSVPLGMIKAWRPLRLSLARHCTLVSEGSDWYVPSTVVGAPGEDEGVSGSLHKAKRAGDVGLHRAI